MKPGGRVIETVVLADEVWINCQNEFGGRCAVTVEHTPPAACVSEGDYIRWTNGKDRQDAYWTPLSEYFHDYILRMTRTPGSGHPLHRKQKQLAMPNYDT